MELYFVLRNGGPAKTWPTGLSAMALVMGHKEP